MENCDDNGCTTEDQSLDEYVLADVGKIWMGSFGSATGRQWVFGQYDDATLPVCCYLLERCGLLHHDRGNPVLVSRALSKMVISFQTLNNKKNKQIYKNVIYLLMLPFWNSIETYFRPAVSVLLTRFLRSLFE